MIKEKRNSKGQNNTLHDFLGLKPPTPKKSILEHELGTGILKGDELKIVCWNVNGIRAINRKGFLKQFLDKYKDFQLICFNETKIDSEKFEENYEDFNFPSEYKSYFSFSKAKKGYSGVGFLSKVAPISVIEGIDKEIHDQEGRVITLEFDNFFICCVYVPNSKSGLQRLEYRTNKWDRDFFNFLEDLKTKKQVIVCGDFNVAHKEADIYDPETLDGCAGFTKEERVNFDKFLKKGWVDCFRELNSEKVCYSFWNVPQNLRAVDKGWRIDYFLVPKETFERVLKCEYDSKQYGSDHCPVYYVMKLEDSQEIGG